MTHMHEHILHNDKLMAILSELNSRSSDIEVSSLTLRDGLPLAITPATDFDEDKLGGVAAAILSLSEKLSDLSSRGSIEQIIVKGETGNMLITTPEENTFLTVFLKPTANLDQMAFHTQRASDIIREVL